MDGDLGAGLFSDVLNSCYVLSKVILNYTDKSGKTGLDDLFFLCTTKI